MSFTTDVSFLPSGGSSSNGSSGQVSMSFTTDVSFLLTPIRLSTAFQTCLNVLYYGRLISTKGEKMIWKKEVLSQCPLLRTSHFYKEKHLKLFRERTVSMSFTTDVSFLQVRHGE